MGCLKKTYDVLFLAGAQNAANSFNFQICQQLGQNLVENKTTPALKFNGVLEIYNELKLKCLY